MTSYIIDILLDTKEWQTFDCKRARIKPAKILETICAFVNTDGGTIVIGLEDPRKASRDKRLIGIDEASDNTSEILHLLTTEFNPPIKHNISTQEIDIINTNGEQDRILLIKVQKGEDICSLKNGDTFVRNGEHNHKIGASEITRLRYEKGQLKYEDELINGITIDDLDVDLLSQYQTHNNSLQLDKWQFLKDNGLAARTRSKWTINKSAVILFGKNPTVLLKSKTGIKISHYYGTTRNYSGKPNFVRRPFSIEGPAIHQIEQTIAYFRDIVKNSPPKLTGAYFLPSLLIPEWAFQEAITNAVVHRNYFNEDDIQVRFFDDHIEVESPGTYPGFITPNNIRRERFARNPVIQRTLNRFATAPNLDIGEGVDRIFQVMKENNLYEPVYFPTSKKPNTVLLVLSNLQRINYWDTVSNYLDGNYRIGNRDVREITGIADSTKVTRMLRVWIKQGLIEKVDAGYKGNIYYKKPNADLSFFTRLSYASGSAYEEQ